MITPTSPTTSADGSSGRLFYVPGTMDWDNPLAYVRLFTYVLGHEGWYHLLSNLMVILLIGPLLEEKYGSLQLLEMIAITAGVTGALNILLFDTALLAPVRGWLARGAQPTDQVKKLLRTQGIDPTAR